MCDEVSLSDHEMRVADQRRNWETGLDVEFEFFSSAASTYFPTSAARVCSCRDCGLPSGFEEDRKGMGAQSRFEAGKRA